MLLFSLSRESDCLLGLVYVVALLDRFTRLTDPVLASWAAVNKQVLGYICGKRVKKW